ncbi:NAD-dependent epimerase/dehydratase family protein [Streptomyces atratus]|uniref:NAD-dependent epimerase/dehydratase family protein n=1 Tax=Streptomyces atratus TaxID=1893 RepID=UPI003864E304
MRAFVAGATGRIGSAVVDELISAGHRATGLARSDQAEQALAAKGAGVVRGDLDDLASLRRGAAQADEVTHMANKHDWGSRCRVQGVSGHIATAPLPGRRCTATMLPASSASAWSRRRSPFRLRRQLLRLRHDRVQQRDQAAAASLLGAHRDVLARGH